MTSPRKLGTIVLGATGYVGAELLRLLTAHPHLELLGALSESQAGEPVGAVFPHLAASYPDAHFVAPEAAPALFERGEGPVAVFSAANHGASAGAVAALLEAASGAGREARVVDLSADFRYPTAEAYERVYGAPHKAPELLGQFVCALPEQDPSLPARHVGHPGCFATSILLAVVPLLEARLVEPEIFVSGVTGSTGSGRTPKDTTHHPLRHSNLFAYGALTHRHTPEIVGLAEAATGVRPAIHFVPHSGPFARGIHATLQARTTGRLDAATVREALRSYYEGSAFVRVVEGAPKVKDVAGSNYCHLGAAAEEGSLAVFSVIDNLLKGAAGGGVQWMNRMLGFPEATGLALAAPNWI